MKTTVDLAMDIERRFQHYPPRNQAEIRTHEFIRETMKKCALDITSEVSEKVINSREFSLFLTKMEEAMMHANSAFARNKE